MNKKNNRKGFTIVELVIVIAVIAILATVLVPTFGNVIEKANESKKLQTLRNEYTTYTLQAGANLSDTIYILLDGVYYTVTNGNVVDADTATEVLDGSKTAPTTAGAVIWTASTDSYTVVTAPST